MKMGRRPIFIATIYLLFPGLRQGEAPPEAGSIGEQKPVFPVALYSLCASLFLRTGQSFQRAGGLVCIRVPIKAKVGHKLAANDGPGNTPQIHT